MLLILILSCISFTSIKGQALVPTQCASYFGTGSASPYDNTSIAAIYQRFCSVRQSISQCIENSKENMLISQSPVDWALALTFDKNQFDTKSQLLCQKLPEIATELECLKTHQDFCTSIMSSALPSIYGLYSNGNISSTVAKVSVCGVLNSTGSCYERELSGCSDGVKNFVADYYQIYAADCMGSITDMLPSQYKDSAFVSCALDSFADTIKNLTQIISTQVQNMSSMDSVLDVSFSAAREICQKTGIFANCIVERIKTTTSEIDKIMLQFINVNNLKAAMDLQCTRVGDLKDLYKNSQSCLKAMAKQTAYCGSIYLKGLLPQTSYVPVEYRTTTAAPKISNYADMICPGLKGMVDCMYMPLSRCVKGIDTLIDDTVDLLMSDKCKSLSNRGQAGVNLIPQASVFIQCGMTMASVFMEEGIIPTGKSNQSSSGAADTAMMVRKGMDVVCRNAAWYISCVDQRLSKSKNVIDRFFREIIDFSDNINRTKIISNVCKRHLTDIENNVDCFMSKLTTKQQFDQSGLMQCINKTNLNVWSVFGNPTQMYNMDGPTIRSTFCGPIDGMTKCATNIFGTCSQTVQSLMESLPKQILRTDCGGVRDPSAAHDLKSNTFWTIAVIFISLLLSKWF